MLCYMTTGYIYLQRNSRSFAWDALCFFPAKTAGLIEDSLFVPKQPKQYSFFKDLFPVNLLTSYRWTDLQDLRQFSIEAAREEEEVISGLLDGLINRKEWSMPSNNRFSRYWKRKNEKLERIENCV